MIQDTISNRRLTSPRAFLAAVGLLLGVRRLWKPISEQVGIPHKTLRYTPDDKLKAVFLAILAGSRGMVEVGKRLRPDRALHYAFGPATAADQSVLQDTLDACTPENIKQMKQALADIYRTHSQGYKHNYTTHFQLLDADMTGMPCGKKAEFATKGYFAHQRDCRGRQLARCVATYYHEILAEQLYDGKTQLQVALIPLLQEAISVLKLDASQRAHTIIRVDSGGGTQEDINWVLSQGFAFHGKDYSGKRAEVLALSVRQWIDDPKCPGRQIGWVQEADTAYVRPVVRIAVRCARANGGWGVGVLVSTLSAADVIALTGRPCHEARDLNAVLHAYVYFYDARGGGIETINREDKQGLGLTARNKKRFVAQEMLVLLGALAHNVIVWVRGWIAHECPKVRRYGMMRMVRDVFTTGGAIELDAAGNVKRLTLNVLDPLTDGLIAALKVLFRKKRSNANSGET
jgi:Transposase DDE domain group 1